MKSCPKCGGILEKKVPNRKPKPGQEFYYRQYYKCRDCIYQYMPPEERVYIDRDKQIKQALIQWEKLGKILKGL